MPKVKETGLISVLIPTYNVEDYVEEAINSILNQTYENLEIIVVDDCSTDRTFEILQKMQLKDSRVKLYRNSENKKICKTLNFAYSISTGEYIGRMDGDDISTPDRLEHLKRYLDNHLDVSLVGSNIITINENGEEISKKEYIQTHQYISKGNKYQPCVSHIWLARRKIYEELNGYREVPYVEDWDFLLRGEEKGYKYGNVSEYIYKVRIRQGNTGSTNGLRQRKAGEYVLELHRKALEGEAAQFNEEEYRRRIECSEKELNHYRRGANYLDLAIKCKKRPLKMVLHITKAAAASRYIRRYLYNVTMVRIIHFIESRRV